MTTLFTLGTGGVLGKGDERDINFLGVLEENRIDLVLDIRLFNEGRYYKFASGKHIKGLVQGEGICLCARHKVLAYSTNAERVERKAGLGRVSVRILQIDSRAQYAGDLAEGCRQL